MVGVWLLGVGLATVVQFWVGSDEINKEEKYLARNIEYTQSAYQLNDVSVKKFSADENLTGADIEANKDTISNVRINDYSPVKTFLQSNPEHKTVLQVQRCRCGPLQHQREPYADLSCDKGDR